MTNFIKDTLIALMKLREAIRFKNWLPEWFLHPRYYDKDHPDYNQGQGS